jgi:hypothetical protein
LIFNGEEYEESWLTFYSNTVSTEIDVRSEWLCLINKTTDSIPAFCLRSYAIATTSTNQSDRATIKGEQAVLKLV